MNNEDEHRIIEFPDRAARQQRASGDRKGAQQQERAINLPPAVAWLCGINIAVFLLFSAGDWVPEEWLYAAAFVPARHTAWGAVSVFTSMFVHAGWLHLGMNIGMLMAFGAALEKYMGWKRFLLLYAASGLCGALLHWALYFGSPVPVVGASGAISGLFGAVMVMMQSRGRTPLAGFRSLLPVIVLWVAISLLFGMFGSPGIDNPVAWAVHIGGFLGGMALFRPVARLRLPTL